MILMKSVYSCLVPKKYYLMVLLNIFTQYNLSVEHVLNAFIIQNLIKKSVVLLQNFVT